MTEPLRRPGRRRLGRLPRGHRGAARVRRRPRARGRGRRRRRGGRRGARSAARRGAHGPHMPGRNGIDATRAIVVGRAAHRRARAHDARGRRVGVRRRPGGRPRLPRQGRAAGRAAARAARRSPTAARCSAPRSRAGWSTSSRPPRPPASATPFPDLTAREREILDLVARGRSNEQIAAQLVLVDQDRPQPRLEHLHQDPGRRPRAGDRQGPRGRDRRRGERGARRDRRPRRRAALAARRECCRPARSSRAGAVLAAARVVLLAARRSERACRRPAIPATRASADPARRRWRAAAARRADARAAAAQPDRLDPLRERARASRSRSRPRSTRSTRTSSAGCPAERVGRLARRVGRRRRSIALVTRRAAAVPDRAPAVAALAAGAVAAGSPRRAPRARAARSAPGEDLDFQGNPLSTTRVQRRSATPDGIGWFADAAGDRSPGSRRSSSAGARPTGEAARAAAPAAARRDRGRRSPSSPA